MGELKAQKCWAFGNTAKMADELLALVLAGKKTATSSTHQSYLDDKEEFPKAGEIHGINDSQGITRVLIDLYSVEFIPFKKVSAEYAAMEGEGDLSLRYWREAHLAYFLKYLPNFNDESLVVCEKFRVLRKL